MKSGGKTLLYSTTSDAHNPKRTHTHTVIAQAVIFKEQRVAHRLPITPAGPQITACLCLFEAGLTSHFSSHSILLLSQSYIVNSCIIIMFHFIMYLCFSFTKVTKCNCSKKAIFVLCTLCRIFFHVLKTT